MALGLTGRLKQLEAQLDPTDRYLDMAARLVVYDRINDELQPTGETSRIFGGVWDRWTGRYTGDEPERVIELRVSGRQFEYCLCEKPRTTAKGGRGGGKTGGLGTRVVLELLDQPWTPGMVVSPDYDHTTIVWDFALQRLLYPEWFLPGSRGIHRTEKIWRLVNGASVRFRSSDNPEKLRGWDAAWCGLDEEKDIPDKAIGIAWGCLRITKTPVLFGAGTPEVGEYEQRYYRLESDKERCAVFSLPSHENPFVPSEVFDLMRTQMDDRQYRQEILAEFVPLEDNPLVCPSFNRTRHCLSDIPELWKDITRKYTLKKFGVEVAYIGGVDYNWGYIPNICIAYKIFEGRPAKWVAVDIVTAHEHAGLLAHELKGHGYLAADPSHERDIIIFADASGAKDRGVKSSSRLMKQEGFDVRQRRKNPIVRKRVNAFNAKLAPVQGMASWFCLMPECQNIAESLEKLLWDKMQQKLDKTGRFDDIFCAASYPVEYCEPAAEMHLPRIRGVI